MKLIRLFLALILVSSIFAPSFGRGQEKAKQKSLAEPETKKSTEKKSVTEPPKEFRIHTATKSENVSFHLLHKKCGSRVHNQHYCPVCNVVVERDDLVRGFQHAKDQYVQITEEELDTWRRKLTTTSI